MGLFREGKRSELRFKIFSQKFHYQLHVKWPFVEVKATGTEVNNHLSHCKLRSKEIAFDIQEALKASFSELLFIRSFASLTFSQLLFIAQR